MLFSVTDLSPLEVGDNLRKNPFIEEDINVKRWKNTREPLKFQLSTTKAQAKKLKKTLIGLTRSLDSRKGVKAHWIRSTNPVHQNYDPFSS